MKIGRRSSSARRSTPYLTNPLRQQIMSDYARSVEQFAPLMGVETNENNILPVTSYKVKDDEDWNTPEESKGFSLDVDLSLHPEKYKTDNVGNELFKYEQFLPSFLARQNVAKNEARRQAEAALPKTATQKQVDELTDRIYNRDTEAFKNSITAKTPLRSDNIYKKVQEEDSEMEAYRILTDPYKRTYMLGWVDENGVPQDGVLGIMVKMADEELKKQAKIKPGYMNSALAIQSDVAVNNAMLLRNAYKMISGENPAYTDEDGHSYMQDVFPAFLTGRKEVRILNFLGQIVRGTEFLKMADGVKTVLSLQDRLDDVSAMIDEYSNLYQNGIITPEQQELQLALIEERRNILQLIDENYKYVDLLGSYESTDFSPKGSHHFYYDKETGKLKVPSIFGIPIDPRRPRDFWQGIQGVFNKIGASTDIGVHHNLAGYNNLVDTIRLLLKTDYMHSDQGTKLMKMLRLQLYKLLNNYQNQIEQKKQQWSQSAKEETQDLEYIKQHMPVSEVFKANMQLGLQKMEFGDPKTLMFAMPQQLGSSNASLILSLGSMAVKLAAAYAGGPLAIGAGIGVGSQMDITNAAWENNAEVAEGYRRKVEKALSKAGLYNDVINELRQKIDGSENMKAEDLFRRLYNGEVQLDNIKANEAIVDAIYGADLAFQYDMGETARGAYKESMLQLMPVKPIINAVKYGLKKGLYLSANGISKLLGRGEINVEKVVNATGVAAENATAFNRATARASEFINTLPRTLLMDTGSVFKTAGSFGARSGLNMVSEGIEEGVQHVTQNRYISNEYGESSNQGLFKPIVEDMVLGTRLGWEWLTGLDAGSGYISDSLMFAEMRGGALGALFLSTPVHVMSNISSLRSELMASDLVAELAYNEKLSQRDKIEKLKSYIKSITRDKIRYDDVMRKFDRFISINENLAQSARTLGTENKGIAREFIEEARELYKKAVSWVANKDMTAEYKRAGIKQGSDEYNEYLAIVIDQIDRLKESKDALDQNEILGESRLNTEQMNQSFQYADIENDLTSMQLANSLSIKRKAMLLAALEIAQQYDTASKMLEGLGKFGITHTPRKSAIQRRAEMLIRMYNNELGTDIKTVDDFINTFGIIDEELKDIYRLGIVLQSEYDVAKATVSRLLTPVTAVGSVKKLSKQYNQAKKDDEQLQQRIHDDYVKYIDRQKNIHDYVIDEYNNTYLGRDGKEYIVERINGQYVKRLYDRENNEGYGAPMVFNKEEYYEYREIIDARDKSPIDIPSVRETYEASADTDIHRKLAEDMDYGATSDYTEEDESVYKQTPISEEQADGLFDLFFDRFASDDSKWETRGSIKRKARPLLKYALRNKKDKFGRSIAQRISLLHNNGYTFKQIGDKYYAVKQVGVAQAKILLTRTEALFGLFLQEEYGSTPVIRIETTTNVFDNANPNLPATPQPPQEEKEELYQPNQIQQEIRALLKEKANTDKATLVARNGNNYFFRTESGKIVMYTRLHAEIGPQKKVSALSKEKKTEVMEKLVSLWSDKEALKKYIEDLLTEWNEKLASQHSTSSTTYKKNKLDLSYYTTPEALKNQNIIEAIGNLTSGLRDDHVEFVDGPWAKAGNIMDELYRRVVGGDEISYVESIELEYEEVLLSDVMSAEIFDNVISQAKQFRKWLSDNKIVPVTDRVLLHAQLPNGHYVAGETDLIGIDESGNFVLFDFKTSQQDFEEGYTRVYNGYNWSSETQHSRQLTGYDVIVQNEFDHKYPVTHRYIVPINVQYTSELGVFDRFTSVERKPLIELSIDESLNELLNRKHKTKEEINTYVESITDAINHWGESIYGYFDKLSPSTKQALRDLRTTLNNITQRINNLDDDSTFLELDNIQNDLVSLENEFNTLSTSVDDLIQQLIDAGVSRNQHVIDTRGGNPLDRGREDDDPGSRDEREFNPDDDEYDWARGVQDEPGSRERQDAQLEDIVENGPGRRGKKRSFGRSLDDIAEDMQRSGQRQGRISGSLPDDDEGPDTPHTVSGAYGAAPIVTGSKSISEAPDYSKQPPINFQAERKSRSGGYVYYNNAHQEDITGQLGKDASDPDFSEKAIFKLNMGKLEVGLTGDYLSTKIKWGDRTYSVRFYWASKARDEIADDNSIVTINIADKVKNKIKALREAYPGAQLIVSKIARTNGKFIIGSKQKNLLDTMFLTNDAELLTLLDTGIIGISDNGYILPISRSSSARPLYSFTSGIDVTPGFVTLLYDRHYAEDKGGPTKFVPIPLTHKRLTDNDIDLIIDILKNARGKELKTTYRKINVNGKLVLSPISDWYILNTLIRFGDITRITNMGDNFIFDFVRDEDSKEDRTRIEISGVGADRGTLYEVDLTKDEDVQKLRNRLKVSGFVYANNKVMLMHNLDGSVDNVDSNPFKKVSAFFKSDENKSINQIKISDSLVFDRKDIDFNEDGSYIALNGIGWAIRHGWVTTDIEGFGSPRISVEDVDVDEIDREVIQEEQQQKEEPALDEDEEQVTVQQSESFVNDEALRQLTIEDLADNLQSMAMYDDVPFKTQTDISKNPIDVEKARKRIRRMLGKRFEVNIVDGVLKVFEQGKAWAVGACKKDAIVLSRLAEAGTEFHESFHRVMELLFSPKHREKLHKHYIKRYNNGVEMSEVETGERLADMFMNFINNLPDVYLSWNILKTFNQISDWIKAWRSLDDKTLALTFFYAYSGLARFASVSKESSDNFDRIWGDAAYFTTTIKNNEIAFKEFVNGIHLRDGIKFATKLILTGYKIDALGTNLKNLDIRMDTIKKTSWYKKAVGEGVEEKSSLQRQLSEIFDHYGSTLELIVNELERLSIGGKIDRDEEKQTNKQGSDLSIVFQDIDGHMDEFYRYDRKLDLDTSLKIFLSTIPNFRYSTRLDLKWETNKNGLFIDKNGKPIVDENGKPTTDTSKRVRRTKTLEDGTVIPIGTVDELFTITKNGQKIRTQVEVSTNSLGVSEFMDFETVYALLVSKLQSSENVLDMINRLRVLAKDDPMFRYVYANVWIWNNLAIVRHPDTQKDVVMIGDMKLDQNDYTFRIDQYTGERHIVYAHDAEGHRAGEVIQNAYILTNVDKEALVTRMFLSFKSQRLKFIFVFENAEKDSHGNATGRFSYDNRETNSTASSRIYPRQWFDNLRYGLTDVFEIIGDHIRVKSDKKTIFKIISNELKALQLNMFNESTNGIFTINYNGEDYTLNKYAAEDLDFIEEYFISRLNVLGIDISKPVLDYYLNTTYPDIENKTDRFILMLSAKSRTASFGSFLKMIDGLDQIVSKEEYTKILVDNKTPATRISKAVHEGLYIYAENAFVKELGTAYGNYRLATNEFMTLGPENTKMYTMALNHSGAEFTDDFNKAIVDEKGNVSGSPILEDMMKFCYNYINIGGKSIGSVVIKHLLKRNHLPLELGTFIGTKRDDTHDGGVKYTKISKREDWISKATILSNGGIIFPTLSDKSTWFYLTGVKLPGISYEELSSYEYLPMVNSNNGRIIFTANDNIGSYEENDVLEQFREYAFCEREAVVKAINELKTLKENERSEKNPGKKLLILEQIKNFHTNNQAARFAFLLGIYYEDPNDPNYHYKGKGERFISFNFNKKYNSETGKYEDANLEDCLKLADKYFFTKSRGELRSMIANILQHRLDDELEWAVEYGIIEKKTLLNGMPYTEYRNKLLDYKKIDALVLKYKTTGNVKGLSVGSIESMAVVAYIMDINSKSIMSTEEVMRLYTGIPHFFKWKYGDDGILTDMHGDLVKRLGGLGSTGDTNRMDLPNIARDYTVAEIKDEEIRSEIYEAYKEGFLDNEYRVTVFQQEVDKLPSPRRRSSIGAEFAFETKQRQILEEEYKRLRQELWERIQNMPLDDVKNMASERTRRIIEANAIAETKSFESGINVADGTAFISPQMTLNLLRERGAFTYEVKKAFDYLMGLDAGSTQLSNHKAYNIIMEALISTQKYSAFGYRMQNDVPIHYYNKFALFPIFKVMAYGFTKDMYDKMLEDGVDMLMFESAVKVGNQGGVKFTRDAFRQNDNDEDDINWEHDKDGNRTTLKQDIKDFHFNTYKLQYKFIRRQLNTDPREDEKMHIGTQMLKITLLNLFKEAIYNTDHGRLSGEELRDDIMECMNELARRGLSKLKDLLFTNDKPDVIKMSKFLKEELGKRNADKNTLRSLDIIEEEDAQGNKHARFRTPLEAMSNLAWIESIIISHINREVIDINLPGNAFYQRTPFGIEGSPIRALKEDMLDNVEDKSKLLQIIDKAKKQFQIYSGRSLKAINNEGSMDCLISIDYFLNQKGLIPEEYRGDYWAIRRFLKKNNIIGKNAKAIMVGYRIPTQAESSVHALRVVDVLPVVRDTIILPKDFTKITGSDFDIDKLYLTSFNFKRNEDDTVTTEFDESDDKHWQNRLLDNYLTLLKDGGTVEEDENGKLVYKKGRTLQFLHRSIDNDTKLVKGDPNGVYERIIGNRANNPEQPFGYQSLHTQVDIKTQFIGGKFGIGPYALANNAQILTMLYDVEFKDIPGGILSELGANSLHNRTDKNGNSILAWLSAMINMHVDVAKDPAITELNVNSYTYGLSNLLLRTGMGDLTFMFLCQPIMREAASAFELSGGNLVDDPGKSKTMRQEQAVQDRMHALLDNLGPDYKELLTTVLSQGRVGDASELQAASTKIVQVAKQLFGVENGQYVNGFYRWNPSKEAPRDEMTVGKSILEDILTNPEVLIDPNKPVTMSNLKNIPYYAIKVDGEYEAFTPKEVQLFVIGAMYEFRPYVNALENVVKYTKIDTKKQGNTWAEYMDYIDNYESLFTGDESSSMFTDEINDMLEKSFIHTKTEMFIKDELGLDANFLTLLLKNSAILYTEGFRQVVNIILEQIKNHTDAARVKINRMILGYIKAQFFNDYMRRNDINPKSLFVGANSIANRVVRMKHKMKQDTTGKYSDYASNSVITNGFLAAVETVPYEHNARQPLFVKLNKAMVDDPDMIDDIIDGWAYMLNDKDNDDVRLLARDLVVYAFLTSADTNGFTKFFKYVPIEWKEESGYNTYMKNLLNMTDEDFVATYGNADVIDNMILNNWFDNTLVPVTQYTESSSNNGLRFIGKTVKTNDPILKKSGILSIMGAIWKKGMNGNWRVSLNAKNAQRFIKIRRRRAMFNEEDLYLLYKLIGFGRKVINKESIDYPIYALVKPNGMSVDTKTGNYFNIYEYNNPFGFVTSIDGIVNTEADVLSLMDQADSIRDWMQRTPGGVISEHPAYSQLAKLRGEEFRDLSVDIAYGNRNVEHDEILTNEPGIVKIISGGLTGVDTIGLEVGRQLGIQTGGTTTPGFVREKDVDSYTRELLEQFGLVEISADLLAGRSGKEFYKPRTEKNVMDSDGTVYFQFSGDPSGKIATEKYAKEHGKPFILNPSSAQLALWIVDNNIKVLNVAGNRGSKLGNNRDFVVETLTDGIKYSKLSKEEREGKIIKDICNGKTV